MKIYIQQSLKKALPSAFLFFYSCAVLAGVEDVWNASPPTNDTVWAQQNARPVKPGWSGGDGSVGDWVSHGASGSFTAAQDGYLTVKSCHNCTVIIYAGGAERCYVDRRDKYGQGRTSCNAIIKKGEAYSISGGEVAYWRDI